MIFLDISTFSRIQFCPFILFYAKTGCSEWDFHCNNGQCIHTELQCDKKDDCQDGTDEINCGWAPRIDSNKWFEQCNENELTCTTGNCVPMTSRCNGIKECPDGSDEINCGQIYTFLL